MKNYQQITEGPKDGGASKGPNAKAVEAIASGTGYTMTGCYAKRKTGQPERADPNNVDASRARAPERPVGESKTVDGPLDPEAASSVPEARKWAYKGKRARVLESLASSPGGVTQWDTLPWHTRLGGTIHAMRKDGLLISTEIEGEYRHARYRLVTPGRLIIQPENSARAVFLHRGTP